MNIDLMFYVIALLGITGIVVFAFFYSSFLRNNLLLISFILTVIGLFGSIYGLLGNAVPLNPLTSFMYRNVDEGQLLYVELNETDGYITMLLRLSDYKEPILVKRPWSTKMANQITKIIKEIEDTKARQQQQAQLGQPGSNPAYNEPPPDGEPGMEGGTNLTGQFGDAEVMIARPFDLTVEDRTNPFRHEWPFIGRPTKPR
jgi:hypothetical protein